MSPWAVERTKGESCDAELFIFNDHIFIKCESSMLRMPGVSIPSIGYEGTTRRGVVVLAELLFDRMFGAAT